MWRTIRNTQCSHSFRRFVTSIPFWQLAGTKRSYSCYWCSGAPNFGQWTAHFSKPKIHKHNTRTPKLPSNILFHFNFLFSSSSFVGCWFRARTHSRTNEQKKPLTSTSNKFSIVIPIPDTTIYYVTMSTSVSTNARVLIYIFVAQKRKKKEKHIEDDDDIDEVTDKVLKPSATAALNHQVVKPNKRTTTYLCSTI